MIETHPFGAFIPKNARYLILGSFTGREVFENAIYDWFYETKRNQFWPILEMVYGVELKGKGAKQKLFSRLGIAISDIIYQCERRKGSNLDMNLVNVVYNIKMVGDILKKVKIEKIYFTSRFVEARFKRHFKDVIAGYPDIELITLPSPSPRYAAMRRDEKVKKYKKLLPSLD